MGLLDDAIRDHLELKRRHGADPSEVERQEQEALGPARRDAAEAGPVVADLRAFDQEEPDEYDPRPGDEVIETTDEEEPVYDEDLLGEEHDEDALPAPDEPRGALSLDRFEEERDAGDEPEPPHPAGSASADEIPLAGEEPGEDVLEETPEFLQETPEHERLWFEQKPPRDFDF
jgi:hypothetical protein